MISSAIDRIAPANSHWLIPSRRLLRQPPHPRNRHPHRPRRNVSNRQRHPRSPHRPDHRHCNTSSPVSLIFATVQKVTHLSTKRALSSSCRNQGGFLETLCRNHDRRHQRRPVVLEWHRPRDVSNRPDRKSGQAGSIQSSSSFQARAFGRRRRFRGTSRSASPAKD